MAKYIDLGERLVRLADRVLSQNTNETIGHSGGITNATATDTSVPTTKAIKEYVDNNLNLKMDKTIAVTPTSSTNLDDYKTANFYTFFNNAAVATISTENKASLPADLDDKSFYLLVENKTNYTKQTLTRYHDGTTWIRTYNTSWGAWKKISFEGHQHQKTDITDFSHDHGNLSNDGKISNESNAIMQYFAGVGATANSLYKSAKLTSDAIIDSVAHTNIGTQKNATQSNINNNVDSALERINYTKISNATSTNENVNISDYLTLSSNSLINSSDHSLTMTDDGNNIFDFSSLLTSEDDYIYLTVRTDYGFDVGGIIKDGSNITCQTPSQHYTSGSSLIEFFIYSDGVYNKNGALLFNSDQGLFFTNEGDNNTKVTFNTCKHYHQTRHSNVVDMIYPVGSIYMSVNNTSPSILFGGTWVQIQDRFLLASGSTYTGGSTGGAATVALTSKQMPRHTHTQNAHTHTQNAHTHTQSSHNHTPSDGNYFQTSKNDIQVDNDRRVWPSTTTSKTGLVLVHAANPYNKNTAGSGMSGAANTSKTTATNNNTTATNQNTTATNKYAGGSATTEAAANGDAHNNMPPYLAVYIWKRTA